MRKFSYPSWAGDLQSRVNQTGGAGMPAIVQEFDLFNRAGIVVADSVDSVDFLNEFDLLVERYEGEIRTRQSLAERLKTLRYPNLLGKNWKAELHVWMQDILDGFLGYSGTDNPGSTRRVIVPEPPNLNRAQRRLLNKYQLWLFFVPAIDESEYPDHMVKLGWNRSLSGADVESLPLPDAWIAFEVIRKPNYQDGVYPDDRLVADIGLQTRFSHPHSDKGEGDDLMEDLLPTAATVFKPLGGQTRVPPAKFFNFLGNLFNWLRQNTAEDRLPDLGVTNSVEWCEERCGSRCALIVGDSGLGGLACVGYGWRDGRSVSIAFRFLVQFPTLSKSS